jgi:hypothetical protein
VAAEVAVGVPESVPFEELRLKPAGRAGETVKLDRPGEAVGTTGVTADPTTNTNVEEG